MDASVITALAQSINTAKTIATAALELRDANALAVVVSKLNTQILESQERLLSLSNAVLIAQQQAFESQQTIRELHEALAEKTRYTDFEIRPSFWVKRRNLTPEERAALTPGSAEPNHYFCQRCFANGVKVSISLHDNPMIGPVWCCPNCNHSIPG